MNIESGFTFGGGGVACGALSVGSDVRIFVCFYVSECAAVMSEETMFHESP